MMHSRPESIASRIAFVVILEIKRPCRFIEYAPRGNFGHLLYLSTRHVLLVRVLSHANPHGNPTHRFGCMFIEEFYLAAVRLDICTRFLVSKRECNRDSVYESVIRAIFLVEIAKCRSQWS